MPIGIVVKTRIKYFLNLYIFIILKQSNQQSLLLYSRFADFFIKHTLFVSTAVYYFLNIKFGRKNEFSLLTDIKCISYLNKQQIKYINT